MDKPICVALDFSDEGSVLALVEKLDHRACRLKVGKQLFTQFGPSLVHQLIDFGFDVFLDLKFHDIPNTVAKAVAAAADMGVWMVNVHALGGPKMMQAAAEALAGRQNRPLLIAVTVLTSHDAVTMDAIGIQRGIDEQVKLLTDLAITSGCDGVVCSAHEAAAVKLKYPKAITVTPGIRLAGQSSNDQQRVMTPQQALEGGSDVLVMGRSLTQEADPMAIIESVNRQALVTRR